MSLCNHKRFDFILATLFFIEAIFFPIPIDPLLAITCFKKPKLSLYYGLIATLASVAGGIAAYYIGAFLWDIAGSKLIEILSAQKVFSQACTTLSTYEYWAVIFAGFTPFPYKIITLSTGFCRTPIMPFILASLLSRGARFFLIATLARQYKEKVQYYIDQYGTILLILFIVIFFILSFSSLG